MYVSCSYISYIIVIVLVNDSLISIMQNTKLYNFQNTLAICKQHSFPVDKIPLKKKL